MGSLRFVTSGVCARDASGQAAEQRDEAAPFPTTEMHPIPHGPGAHCSILDCTGSVSGTPAREASRWESPRTCSAGLRASAAFWKTTPALLGAPSPAARLARPLLPRRAWSWHAGGLGR